MSSPGNRTWQPTAYLVRQRVLPSRGKAHASRRGWLPRPANNSVPHIYIGRIFSVPRCTQLVIPYTLQIGRLTAGLRTAYQKITSELEIERSQLRVEIRLELPNPYIGRPGSSCSCSQIDGDTRSKYLPYSAVWLCKAFSNFLPAFLRYKNAFFSESPDTSL